MIRPPVLQGMSVPHLAHVITLQPTSEHERLFRRAAGCARFAYNWALARWNELYESGGKTSWMSLQHEFVSRIEAEYPFMRLVPCHAYYQPFRHLNQAFQNFFNKTAEHPDFKRKHSTKPSFKVGRVRCDDYSVVIPRIGTVRMREKLRFPGRIISATISADADRWTISILVDVPESVHKQRRVPLIPVVGVDLGLKTLATLSSGERVPNSKPLRFHLRRLRRLDRQHSRRRQGSKRKQKARLRLARLHRRIRRLRHHISHTLTTQIVQTHQTIVIEDLHVSGMMKNHRLAQAIGDVGWGEIRRQLTYKCVRYERTLVVAHRFFPSSKRCYGCGLLKKALPLSCREFQCAACGLRMDRDLNAALNLSTLAERGYHAQGEPTVDVLLGNRLHVPARRSANPDVRQRAKRHPRLKSHRVPGI